MPLADAISEGATRRLAEFAASLDDTSLPEHVIVKIKQLLLDTLGVTLAATTLGSGCKEVVSVMRALGGAPESHILGIDGVRVAAPHAAFANGALAHALNFDAIGATAGHVGIVCLAAPLAVAEAAGRVSGRRFLAAVCAGAEVAARLKAAIVPAGRSSGPQYLSGQMLGYFGCAAGAGNVLGLTPQEMHSAFGLSLMQASGSIQMLLEGDPPAKAIYGGFPNQAGVLAALLSKAGLGAECSAVEGEAGLFGLINSGLYNRDTLLDDLGVEFRFTEAQCKPWPTSIEAHPFIEAAIQLHRHKFDPAAIGEVKIAAPSRVKAWLEPADTRCRPPNAVVAANSIPFAVAKTLCNGDLTLADLTPDGLADKTALNVAGKVRYLVDDTIRGGAVEVTTTDGMTQRASVPIHATRPMPQENVVAKFRQCCRYAASGLTSERIEGLIELIENLEQIEDMRVLAKAASGASG